MLDVVRMVLGLIALHVIASLFWPIKPFASRREVLIKGSPILAIIMAFSFATAPTEEELQAQWVQQQAQREANKRAAEISAMQKAELERAARAREHGEWADEVLVSGVPYPVDRAAKALRAMYEKKGYYAGAYFVTCAAKYQSERYFIRCYPDGGEVPGGLFAVSRENGAPVVTAVNGKAQTALGSVSTLIGEDGRGIAVKGLDEAGLRQAMLKEDLGALIQNIK